METSLFNSIPVSLMQLFCETDSIYNLYFPFSQEHSDSCGHELLYLHRMRLVFVLTDIHSVTLTTLSSL